MTLLNSDIAIDAPSEVVWQVLVDFDSYPDWNPVEIEERGEAVVGAAFQHTAKLPGRKPMTFKAKIIEAFMRGVLRDTQAAFQLANQAIKQRAESLSPESSP